MLYRSRSSIRSKPQLEPDMQKERLTTFVPPALKRKLEESARENRRSLASEVQVALERAVPLPPRSESRTSG